ncbi:phage head spike fiber domain-containing protein [Halomonas litopenaei]|uniref:phage head spike fiber domain-containing protein n=1 Tax=Halomonas litopenaei TaxID=2109328 RepID=UPI003FA170CC
MNIRLQGILLDGYGEPLPNASIAFRAKRTTDVVLGCTVAQARADRYGRYDITVEGGYYSLIINGHEYLKGVLIDENLTVTDLNELILQGTTEDNVDSVIVEFREIQAEVEAALAEAEQRVGSSQELLDARDTAVQSANSASASATSAAEDAALVEALADTVAEPTATYASVSAALSATTDGDYFRVIAVPSAALVEVYRNDGGSATLITTYYTKGGVDQTNEQITRLNRSFSLKPYAGESLRSDFVNQAYGLGDVTGVSRAVGVNDMFTVERSSPKFVPGPQGRLVEVPPDTIAYHYDSVTGEALGALIEGESTNIIQYSEDFSGRSLKDVVAISDAIPSPIPGVMADRIESSVSPGVPAYWRNNFTFEAGEFYCHSIFAKAGEINTFSMRGPGEGAGDSVSFNLSTGQASVDFGYTQNYGMKELTDGWYRCWIVTKPGVSGTDNAANTYLSGSNAGEGAYFFGEMLEQAGSPTSYIPTDGAPVTRGADTVYRVCGDEQSTEYTVFIDFAATVQPERVFAGYFSNETDDVGLRSFQVTLDTELNTLGVTSRSPGNGVFAKQDAPFNVGERYKCAITISRTSPSVAVNGSSTIGSGDNTGLPQVIHIRDMIQGLSAPGMEVYDVRYFPYAMDAAELEALTS